MQAEISRLLGLPWPRVLDLYNEASAEIPLVEALCGVESTNTASMQLALSVLRNAPQRAVRQ